MKEVLQTALIFTVFINLFTVDFITSYPNLSIAFSISLIDVFLSSKFNFTLLVLNDTFRLSLSIPL